jgi:hypothetical protein
VQTKKGLSHVHARTFWGESDASPLLDWLNGKNRPHRDPVERIVLLHKELRDPVASFRRYVARSGDARDDIRKLVARTIRTWRFTIVPVVGNTLEGSWTADWRHMARVSPAQALAFVKALHLANQQLLDRVRRCRECGTWFFARMIHKESCSTRCQQVYIRSSEEFKQKRREDMRRLRRMKKEQQAKWLALSKTEKRKGRR